MGKQWNIEYSEKQRVKQIYTRIFFCSSNKERTRFFSVRRRVNFLPRKTSISLRPGCSSKIVWIATILYSFTLTRIENWITFSALSFLLYLRYSRRKSRKAMVWFSQTFPGIPVLVFLGILLEHFELPYCDVSLSVRWEGKGGTGGAYVRPIEIDR